MTLPLFHKTQLQEAFAALRRDLIQAGMIGLIEASRKFDPEQGASFETYAGIRIRGAMLDEIRRTDWTPRSVHRKARDVAEAVRKIENEKGRDARDVEVAKEMGLELDEYHKILQDATGCRIFSFEDPGTIGEDGYAPDENRLVQWWFWYSVYDNDVYPTGNLWDEATGHLTHLGHAWSQYIAGNEITSATEN